MEVSEDKLELVNKIKKYRGCKESIKNLKMENDLLKADNGDYKDVSVIEENLNLMRNIKSMFFNIKIMCFMTMK